MTDDKLKSGRLADGYEYKKLSVAGQEIEIFYKPAHDGRGDVFNHAEFYSGYVSETGYYSHFFHKDQLLDYGSLDEYLTELTAYLHEELMKANKSKARRGEAVKVDDRQTSIF